MALEENFNASRWIAQYEYGTPLEPETSATVASFTTMWNVFEGMVCNHRASIAEFTRHAATIDKLEISDQDLQTLEDCLAFWTFRYRTPDGFSDRFLHLHFRSNDRKELVEEVLQGTKTELTEKVLALMIIVYRLRNNLFHGMKAFHGLDRQVPNLNVASQCLAALVGILTLRRSMARAMERG